MTRESLNKVGATLLAVIALTLSTPGLTAEEYILTLKGHKFEPAEIRVPAGKKVKLVIDNRDPTPEEFHSDALKREEVVLGGKKSSFFIGPLKAGSYTFMGELHEATAKGRVIAE